jgi:hypothetical protein
LRPLVQGSLTLAYYHSLCELLDNNGNSEFRPRFNTPKGLHEPLSPQDNIVIEHPAYDDDRLSNHMLTFLMWDRKEGGLHFGTVHLACSIIACNTFYGFLSTDRAGDDAVTFSTDQIFPPGEYYFHVPYPSSTKSSPYRYPVCPTFRQWKFPHNLIPRWWIGAEESESVEEPTQPISGLFAAVLSRDKACVLSGQREFVRAAHLCPRAENVWY